MKSKKLPKRKSPGRPRKLDWPEITDLLLREMFRRVSAPWPPDSSDREWFRKHTWTQKECDDFKEWAIVTVLNHRGTSRLSKKHVEYQVGLFLLNYGWSIKEEDNAKTKP